RTAISVKRVRHSQHPAQNGTPHYQTTRDLSNNARFMSFWPEAVRELPEKTCVSSES
ncbi:MAG: hypothetical protein ACI9VX_002497, partial [Dinoroseobacter sp.]